MADKVNSTVTIQFAPFDDKVDGSYLLWEEDTDIATVDMGQRRLRLYPDIDCKTFSTSGTLSRLGSDSAHSEETLVFIDSMEVALSKKPTGTISIESLGSFYDADGSAVYVTFSYDPLTNSVIASTPGFGVVKVSYTYRFKAYLYTHTGPGCGGTDFTVGSLGGSTSGGFTSGGFTGGGFTSDGFTGSPVLKPYDDGQIVAIDLSTGMYAELFLEGPECSDTSVIDRTNEARLPSIVLDIHPDYPPRLIAIGDDDTADLVAGCKLYVTPGDSSFTIHAYPGELISDMQDAEPLIVRSIKDVVTFNNSGSVNLSYQADSNVQVTALSLFYDQYGDQVSPNFAKPGDRVQDVEWLSRTSYQNPIPRYVNANEIVVTNSTGKVINATGAIEASYTVKSKRFKLIFEQEISDSGTLAGWKESYVVTYDDNEVGQRRIDPPTYRES